MKARYVSSLLFVSDIKTSRDFYESVLGQSVGLDHGECVAFSAGFSIMLRDYAYGIIFKEKFPGEPSGKHHADAELYFETDDVEGARDLLMKHGVPFVHDIFEQPWGQRVFRVYDPDKYIIEFGEPMDAVIKRFIGQGMSIEDTAARTSMPPDIVRRVAKQIC